jgi:hypothetical protein
LRDGRAQRIQCASERLQQCAMNRRDSNATIQRKRSFLRMDARPTRARDP